MYDQHGEEGLKDMPPSDPGSSSYGNNKNGFNPRNAEDIFAEFFGTSPFDFGSSPSAGRGKRYPQNEGGSDQHMYRTYSEGGGSSTPKKPQPIENKLPCTLEELYTGSTRKMKISRTIVDSNG